MLWLLQSGFPITFEAADLAQVFSRFGRIINVKILRKEDRTLYHQGLYLRFFLFFPFFLFGFVRCSSDIIFLCVKRNEIVFHLFVGSSLLSSSCILGLNACGICIFIRSLFSFSLLLCLCFLCNVWCLFALCASSVCVCLFYLSFALIIISFFFALNNYEQGTDL